MKDSMLCVHVGFKALNLEISRWRLADDVGEFHWSACRLCSTIAFPHSTNHVIIFYAVAVVFA